MKIVDQTVTLEWITPDAMEVLESAARTCYKSEDKIGPGSAEKLVRHILDLKDESILEHASARFRFVTDRGVTHELVRHRLASFSQESTRYCNYSKDKFSNEISVVKPVNLDCEEGEYVWNQSCRDAEESYFHLLKLGYSPQLARSVLPNSLKTEIVVTANFREWRHIIKLRTSPAAHPQIQALISTVKGMLIAEYPLIFENI